MFVSDLFSCSTRSLLLLVLNESENAKSSDSQIYIYIKKTRIHVRGNTDNVTKYTGKCSLRNFLLIILKLKLSFTRSLSVAVQIRG